MIQATIITAEISEGSDGKPILTGCVVGNEMRLYLLTAHIIEKIADTTGESYPDVEAKIRVAHAWSASQKEINNIIDLYEGGKRNDE